MEKVEIIAAGGARIVGPCTVKLTREQYERRSAKLGKWIKSGTFKLDGGQVLQFKYGEKLSIGDAGKLNRLLFKVEEKAKKKSTKKSAAPEGGGPPGGGDDGSSAKPGVE